MIRNSRLRRLIVLTSYTLMIFITLTHLDTLHAFLMPIGAILFVLTIVATIRIHSMYHKKHDEPSDFPRIITESPYGICRHPFYTVLIINQHSIALIGCSLEGLLVGITMLPLWILLIKIEEKELINQWTETLNCSFLFLSVLFCSWRYVYSV